MEFLAPLATFGSGLMNAFTSASNTDAQIQAQEQMQAQSEQFNAGQAQINREYQTQMSNTAYQRASKDMTAAGLNPMMMFGSGGPASSPSGSTASIGTPTAPQRQNTNPLQGLGPAAEMYVNSAVASKTIDKLTQEVANLKATEGLTGAQTAVEKAREPLTQAETAQRQQETKTEAARTDIARSESTSAAERASEDFAKMKLPQWLFDTAIQGGFLGHNTAKAIEPVGSVAGLGYGIRALRDVVKGW